jgi:hypothetical protein
LVDHQKDILVQFSYLVNQYQPEESKIQLIHGFIKIDQSLTSFLGKIYLTLIYGICTLFTREIITSVDLLVAAFPPQQFGQDRAIPMPGD